MMDAEGPERDLRYRSALRIPSAPGGFLSEIICQKRDLSRAGLGKGLWQPTRLFTLRACRSARFW